jgi:hypothetical protein
MARYQIAQLNIGRTVAPVDDPRLADFMAWLNDINALAERTPGFVWRLQSSSGNATDIEVNDDPLVIVNLTVWESPDALFEFTYRTMHKAVFARRLDWFERWEGPSLVMWWQPEGTIPDVPEALRRLELLAQVGPTPEAFTFKQRFPPPDRGLADRPRYESEHDLPHAQATAGRGVFLERVSNLPPGSRAPR